MNSRNKFIFEEAKESDSKEMLDIIEGMEFKGDISMLYTRRPDPLNSLRMEGDRVGVIICRDQINGKMAGFGACSVNRMHYNGTIRNVGYLFNLRSRKEYQRRFLDFNRGYDRMFGLFEGDSIPVYYTTILEENIHARKLLEKRRPFMPVYEYFGDYHTYIVKTGLRRKMPDGFEFRRAGDDDTSALVEFLDREGSRYQFFPAVSIDDLHAPNHPRINNFYLLMKDGKIIGCGALWDQRDYKQYIVMEYKGIYRFLYMLNRINTLFGYPALSKLGGIVNFFTMGFWAVRDDDPDLFEILVRNMSGVSPNYDYFTVGLHGRNPLNEVAGKRIRSIIYKSRLYLVHPENGREAADFDRDMIPYLECGRL